MGEFITIFDGVTAEVTTPVPLDLTGQTFTLPATVAAKGLGSGESITVKFSLDGGATWTDLKINGQL